MPITKEQTALFETFLSEAILAERELYEPIYIKIANGIAQAIEANSGNLKLSREIFALFSLIKLEHQVDKIEVFQKPGFDLEAANFLHKLFFEKYIEKLDCRVQPPAIKPNTLFKSDQILILQDKKTYDELQQRLRVPYLFSGMNRGRIELEVEDEMVTQKFGILPEEKTPNRLKKFYKTEYIPGYSQFKVIANSKIVKFMEEHQLPYVCGPSGTVVDCYSGISKLGVLTTEEMKTYLMVLAASMVARGHHSFYEVFMVVEVIQNSQQDHTSRKEFYETMLTEEFKQTASYKQLVESEVAMTILDDSEAIPRYCNIVPKM